MAEERDWTAILRSLESSGTKEEAAELAVLSGYLSEQGHLDASDEDRLQGFLKATEGPLVEDWSRIIEDLETRGRARLADALRDRVSGGVPQAAARYLGRVQPDASWVFLVGAGGSAAAPTSIPTVSEMLPRLWQKAEEIDAPSLLRLRERCVELKITNIEDLLSAIALAQSAAANPSVALLVQDLLFQQRDGALTDRMSRTRPPVRLVGSELVGSLSESSQLLFSVLVGMMKDQPANQIHRSIVDRVRSHLNDVVVTTNYDVSIERAMQPDIFDYRLGVDSGITDAPKLLKLHGSLSWYVCKSCDTFVTASLPEIEAARSARLYPVVAMCEVCAATAQQLIVPPIGAKYAEHPALLEIRQRAEDAFSAADVIVAIGYSFSETDGYITRMISRAIRADPKKTVVIFDRSQTPATRMKKFFAAHTRHTEFDADEGVISVSGPAEETFPAFLREIEGQSGGPDSSAAASGITTGDSV